jgi:hypothetical protein
MDTIDEIIVLLRQVASQVKEEEEREAQERRRRVREILRDSLCESERVGRELLAPYDKG